MARLGFRQEFFDREYPAMEAYARLWRYARRYQFRLAVGFVCGVLTAGTLVPMFSMIQPVLARVESRQEKPVFHEAVARTGVEAARTGADHANASDKQATN